MLKDISEGRNMLETLGDRLHEKGRKEGIQEGQKESLAKVVRSMKKQKFNIKIIAETTGLSIKEIESITVQDS
jgi:predicted transposase/invertase (TIGR01784 family)